MKSAPPALPDDLRLYVIGDIHGRLDLLKQLLEKIDADSKKTSAKIQKIFLGDYIDRGIHSREIIDFLLEWKKQEDVPPLFLLGNHEQVMRTIILDENEELLESWLGFGGRETLLSYGVNPSLALEDPQGTIAQLAEKTPKAHLDFLKKLKVSAQFGDYFFCHAGVKPGVAIADQDEEDLVWIRHEFLNHKEPFGKVVVHGHSISLKAEFLPNRIGIDTGAYATGLLTALALEGTKQWLVQTDQ